METSRTNAQYKRNDRYNLLYEIEWILYLSYEFFSYDGHDRYNDMETRFNTRHAYTAMRLYIEKYEMWIIITEKQSSWLSKILLHDH